jgi:hypothetical protein
VERDQRRLLVCDQPCEPQRSRLSRQSGRPIHQNRFAVKVIGSPFKTFPEAEKACEAVLADLTELSGVKGRSYSPSAAHRHSV